MALTDQGTQGFDSSSTRGKEVKGTTRREIAPAFLVGPRISAANSEHRAPFGAGANASVAGAARATRTTAANFMVFICDAWRLLACLWMSFAFRVEPLKLQFK